MLAPRPYLATSTTVALIIDAARTPVYLARAGDQLSAFVVPIAVATLGCLIGTIAGERLFFQIRPERYRKVVGVAVLVLGLWLIVSTGVGPARSQKCRRRRGARDEINAEARTYERKVTSRLLPCPRVYVSSLVRPSASSVARELPKADRIAPLARAVFEKGDVSSHAGEWTIVGKPVV